MLTVRSIKQEDSKIIYSWSIDKITRENSLKPNFFSYEKHLNWFRAKLNSDLFLGFIINDYNNDIAFVRFECLDSQWTVGIVVAPEFRGKGLGERILRLGLDEFYKYRKDVIFAFIKEQNHSSRRIFERNGFIKFIDGEFITYKKER